MNGLLFAVSSETITRALENTVMGITIVFCMLLLISFIISLLKLVNKIGKKQEPVAKAAAPAPVVVEEDDLELVAVITAAIYDYEQSMGNQIPSGGLVVRSIRKVNKNWQNA